MLAAAGDIPTLEVVAAAWLLRKHGLSLNVRGVNVADLMCLQPADIHPHGLEEAKFIELFTEARPVVLAFHGYQRAVHEIIHGLTSPIMEASRFSRRRHLIYCAKTVAVAPERYKWPTSRMRLPPTASRPMSKAP